MQSKRFFKLYIIFFFSILALEAGCVTQVRTDYQLQEIILRSKIEEAFSDIESAYASKDAAGITVFLDKDFEKAAKFSLSLKDYFSSVENPRVHFIIDTALTEKTGITVRTHWFKKVSVASGAEARSQGAAQFVFKKYPESLKLLSVRGENPFF